VRGRTAAWIAVPVLVVMLAFIVVLAASDPSGGREEASPLIGRQAPPIAGQTIHLDEYDLAEHRGRFVLVNFFATWCTPCIREHPELVNFARRHEAAGDATVVSVVYDDRPKDARRFFEENGGDWPVVTDPDGRISVSYGVSGVPESYLLAPDGRVVTKLVGGVTAAGMDQALAEAKAVLG
jgi:cytochrome c biogenesis protein CcmG/thiol:disulfide interchange protein DsbE